MKFGSKFVVALCAALVSVFSLPAKATVYDWASSSGGTYTIQYLGWFDDGVVSGNQFRKTVTRTAFALTTPPATPFPAPLPYLQSYGDYVVNAGAVVFRGPLHATFWNDDGDALYATGHTTFVSGASYVNEYLFDGGLGAYAGATGWWRSAGTVLSSSYQIWNSVAHMELANDVPEPETLAMMLAGLGMIGFVGRRRQKRLA
ncbi:MAG TPA: PEP-CTERM sorting domain-containing protein [Rhodocyclaceae bacterium]|nr:PEP-CTERM sorting domain-containing protein [Rhodocyclaceae bacterium]